MGWFRVQLTDKQQSIVNCERDSHPDAHVRRKMLLLWSLHTGLTRIQAARVAGVSRATAQRYVAAFRKDGLDGLRQWDVVGPVSDLAEHTATIRSSFTQQPARTIAEAAQRIFELTGIRRQPTQVRKFLLGLGLKFMRVRAIPVPPKKTCKSM